MLERRLPTSERAPGLHRPEPATGVWVLSATSTRRSTPRCGLGTMFVLSPAAKTGERCTKSGPAWLPTGGNRRAELARTAGSGPRSNRAVSSLLRRRCL